MGLQRVGHNWRTELNWKEIYCIKFLEMQVDLKFQVLLWYLEPHKSKSLLKSFPGLYSDLGFLGGSAIKILPAVQEPQESWVWSLGWEDLLKEETATHSSTLALEIYRGAWQATAHRAIESQTVAEVT